MKALIIDERNHTKIVNVKLEETIRIQDHIIPCSICKVKLHERYLTNQVCPECGSAPTIEEIELKGWSWEHPGYFIKQFANVCVVAGTSEYRFDFTICGEDYDMAYGPDFCIDVGQWPQSVRELKHRNFLTKEEFEELEMVYEYLYEDMVKDEVNLHNRGDWEMDCGSLMEPDGMYCVNTSGDYTPIRITSQMLFGNDCGELTSQQHKKFAELQTIIFAWLTTEL